MKADVCFSRTTRIITVGLGLLLLLPVAARAQSVSPDGLWTEIVSGPDLRADAAEPSPLAEYRVFEADDAALFGVLARAPRERTRAAAREVVMLSLPLRDGSFPRFRILESPLFSPELEAANPDILSFVGQGVDDPTMTARFVWTSAGFFAFIRTTDGMVYIEPRRLGDMRQVVAYGRQDLVAPPQFECGLDPETEDRERNALGADGVGVDASFFVAPSGANLSLYDMAVTATGAFTQFFDPGGGTANTRAQIAASVAAVNAIYVPEVAVQFQVVCNNIYTPATDPFSNPGNSGSTIGENQTETDNNCGGSAGYDIGHVFHRRSTGGFSGLAGGNVCNDSDKAEGYSSVQNPVPGTMLWVVDQLSHEIGHQFTAAHTFNSNVTGCAGNRAAGSAYELGSGSTIMSYKAGTRCEFDFPGTNDAYFHGHSFDQITNHRDGGGACGMVSATGNTPPAVNAGSDYTIPQGTPFTLTATGSDANGDALTYCWEQFDLGSPGDVATNVNGPLFRSRPPVTSPSRTFPILSDILAGNPTPTEILPLVNRALNFRVTARDNRATGGGVNNDTMVITVQGGPFEIVDPAGGSSLECGMDTTVNWNVGGGSVAANVRVSASDDGSASFATLVASTSNDGSEVVTVPTETTSSGRMRLDPIGNIFFAISDSFSIADTTAPDLNAPADVIAECTDVNGTPVDLGSPMVSDVCDASPTVSNDAPALFPLGATIVEWEAVDDDGNLSTDTQSVLVQDTIAPIAEILEPTSRQFLLPLSVSFNIVFDVEEDCGVKREVILLDGCAIFDGDTYGDGDGLLRDESVVVDQAEFCRISSLCGRRQWIAPTFTVSITDAGDNIGTTSKTYRGGVEIPAEFCQ